MRVAVAVEAMAESIDGPFEPEGEPVKKGVSTDGTKHWKEYADGTRIQSDPDGTRHYAYPATAAHGIKQYSEWQTLGPGAA